MNTFVRIGRYVLDVALSEDHSFEADVTDFPVESGGSISDNIRPKPIKIKIEGVVSDTPLPGNAKNSPIILGDPYEPAVDKFVSSVNTLLGTVQFLRSEEAYGYLKYVWESKDTVTISTSMGTFDDMAMESFNVPRSKDTTGGLRFTASFRQIKKITNARIRENTAIRNGGKKRSRGTSKGADWFVNEVTWRKATPPGTQYIYGVEQVRWYWKPASSVGPLPVSSSSTTNVQQQAVRNSYINETHKWYHWSGPKGVPNPQPLTADEVRAFNLDYTRDQHDRLLLGDDLYFKGYTRDVSTPGDMTNKLYLPKDATTDMGSQNRRSLWNQTGQSASSGDPNFQNRANYASEKTIPQRPKVIPQVGKIGKIPR